MIKRRFILSGFVVLAIVFSCSQPTNAPVAQISIPRIDQMPELPQPLKIIDWKGKALQFDSLAFNFTPTQPLVR